MRGTASRQIWCHWLNHLHTRSLSHQARHRWRPGGTYPGVLKLVAARSLSSLNNKLCTDPSFFSFEADLGLTYPRCTLESILDRARVHGIDSLDHLAFESDLGPVRGPGKRLLDDNSIRQDLDLWAILLDYRSVKDGATGIKDILVAMLHGGEPVRLQSDSVSGHIWRSILPVVVADQKGLQELCLAHSAFFQGRTGIFADIIGLLLASGNLRLAVVLGTQALLSHFRGQPDLIHLFDVTFRLATKEAITNFCNLISRLPLHRIYADTVPKLLSSGRKQHALILHKMLIERGDHPTKFNQIEPFIQEFAIRKTGLDPFLRHLELNGISYSHQAKHLHAQEMMGLAQRQNMSPELSLGFGPGTRPMQLRDAFVARTFATRSVSFDFVLNGLRFIGLREVGPLAVREMALSAGNNDTLVQRFQQLDKLEIDLGGSNYVHVVKNLSMSGSESLLRAVLDSDMHHEVFEDFQKQKRLLTEYYRNNQWTELNRTLAILNAGKTSSHASFISAQFIVQTALVDGDWRGVLASADTLRDSNGAESQMSTLSPLRFALTRIWASASVQAKNDSIYLDRYLYLTGLMQLAQGSGLRAYAWQWRSVLHAVGRSGDWKLFHSLIFSLIRYLYLTQQAAVPYEAKASDHTQTVLQQFFDPKLQCFIIETSLISDAPKQNPQDVWLRGLQLLYSLAHSFPVVIDYHSLVATFKLRLQELFTEAEIGTRRRLINSYLNQLSWAWSEVHAHDQQTIPHTLYQRGVSVPDTPSLQLFRLRSKLGWQRKSLIWQELDDSIDTGYLDRGRATGISEGVQMERKVLDLDAETPSEAVEVQDQATVFYEDLLHPSYNGRREG